MLYCILLVVTGGLVLNSVVGESGLLSILRVSRECKQLESAVEALRAENDRLQQQAKRLETDPETIEEIARRELGLAQPGEKVFILGGESSAPRPR